MQAFFNITNNKRDIQIKRLIPKSSSDGKIFVQKFHFVLGEHDTVGGRSKNSSKKWRQLLGRPEILGNDVEFSEFLRFLELTSYSRNFYDSWNWHQILGNFQVNLARTNLLLGEHIFTGVFSHFPYTYRSRTYFFIIFFSLAILSIQ